MKWPLGELMRSGTDDLLARRIGAPVGRLSQRVISASSLTSSRTTPGLRYQSNDEVDSFLYCKSSFSFAGILKNANSVVPDCIRSVEAVAPAITVVRLAGGYREGDELGYLTR